jgi:glycosyl transferase family 25
MESAMKSYLIILIEVRIGWSLWPRSLRDMGSCSSVFLLSMGRQLSDVERKYLASLSERWPAPLSPVEIGCFLSHRRCLERIATGEDEFAVIFEDDVRLSQGAARLLSTSDWIPDDADIVKIESHGAQVLISRTVKARRTVFDCAPAFATFAICGLQSFREKQRSAYSR